MALKILKDVKLGNYTTMRVGGEAQFLTEVTNIDELIEALELAKQKNLDFFVLGGGSNTIFTDGGFKGLIILNKIGRDLKFKLEGNTITSSAGANWDDLVRFSVENQLTGIEALSLIPGTVGAAPVQNIGAYGQQVSDAISELEAIDIETLEIIKLKPEQCGFAYRSSRFNRQDQDKGKYLITAAKLKLKKANYQGKLYKDVEAYFKNNPGISIESGISPAQLRDAVIEIRSKKLPDPKQVANTGSFFKNPIISEDDFAKLKDQHPEVGEAPPNWSQPPFWQVEGGYKISAGWLVGQAGFSKFYDDSLSFGTWPSQNLVIYSKQNQPQYKNLQQFRDQLKLSVKLKFGIELQQEPEEVIQ